MRSAHTISLRDSSMTEFADIDLYSQIEYARHRNDGGEFSIRLPILNRAGARQQAADAIVDGKATGVVIRRRGESRAVFSGDLAESYAVESGNKGEPGNITLRGTSDHDIVKFEHAWPSPGTEISSTLLSTQPNAHDAVTTRPYDAMLHYVGRNIGPGALLSRRRYPWLRLPTAGAVVGSQSQRTWKARFEPLDELLNSIANVGGLNYELVQESRSTVGLRISEQALRREVLFSRKAGTLVAGTLVLREASATEGLSLGTGQMTNRVLTRRVGAPGRSPVRRVVLREQTSEDDLAQLQQDLEDALTEGRAQAGCQVITRELPGAVFGKDYFLGDKVSVLLGRTTIEEMVNGVTVTEGKGGVVSVTKVGSGEETPEGVKKIRQLARSLARATRG